MATDLQRTTIDAAELGELYLSGRLADLSGAIEILRRENVNTLEAELYEIYKNIYSRGSAQESFNFLCSIHRYLNDIEVIFNIAIKIYAEHDHIMGANLFFYYISNGGSQQYAYETCIMQCRNQSMHPQAIAIYRQACEKFGPEKITANCLAQVAFCHLEMNEIEQSWDLAKRAYDLDMGTELARIVISRLSRDHSVAPAIILNQNYIRNLARSFPANDAAARDHADQGHRFDIDGLTAETIIGALNRHGLCYVRGGCSQEQFPRILANAQSQQAFPILLSAYDWLDIDALFGFDARRIASELIGTPANFDAKQSAIRKVNPAVRQTFTPFHQDTTAFAKRLVNIWTPLTPAGGEYPSLQLVAKRIDMAEQTIIKAGEYNQIEISEDYVFEKYGDLLVDVNDARPGDCVIFLGTTIHRSANMRDASRPRFNMEIRWS